MKVEFRKDDCRSYGAEAYLFISGSDFKLAENSDWEFDSLRLAMHAFYCYFGLDYYIDLTEYDYLKKLIKSNGALIATFGTERRNIFPVFYVSNNNELKIVDLDLAYVRPVQMKK